jgi:hypothetical protein
MSGELTPKLPADWERIEAEYRAGVLSLREIATQYEGVNHVAIARRAKRDNWTRDLSEKIQTRAESLVTQAAVTGDVTAKRVTEREVIEANAQRIAQVRGEHRHDITRMRALVLRLLSECEAEAADPGVFVGLGEMLRAPDDRGMDRLNDAYQKAVSLPVRIKGVKELAETMKTLVGMEREAYGIVAAEADDGRPKDAGRPMSAEEAYRKMIGG